MILISCDVGKNGAFSVFNNGILDEVINMPTIKRVIKEATYQYKHKDKAIVIKSGPNKGKRPMNVKTPAKVKIEIDFHGIKDFFSQYKNHGEVVFVSEPQYAIGHGKAIYQNYGKILGIALCYCDDMYEVMPQTWQKHFEYKGTDKDRSLKLAHSIFDGWNFETHDQAESALIGQYVIDKLWNGEKE